MRVNSKVVCIDDSDKSDLKKIYKNWIKKDNVYVIREVQLMTNLAGEAGQVGLLLIGINNPPTPWKPFLEMGFNAERFRELEPPKTLTEDEKGVLEEAEELVEV